MGNATSISTQTFFFTSCMAKYTCITKPQVMAIRNILAPKESSNTKTLMIRRRHLHQAMEKTNIVAEPDQEVLHLLFTMWTDPKSEKSKTRAPWYEFMISMSLLACKTDSLDQALRFALHVATRQHVLNTCRTISASDAIAFLNAFCMTASFFGDESLLQPKQIYKIVDRIFDTMSMISSESQSIQSEMPCDDFVKRLINQKAVHEIVAMSPKARNIPCEDKAQSTLEKKLLQNIKMNMAGTRGNKATPATKQNDSKEKTLKKKDSRDTEGSKEDDNSLEDSSSHEDDEDDSQNEENKKEIKTGPKSALKYTTIRSTNSDGLTTVTPTSAASLDMSSNVSSVKLMPLARIAISPNSVLDLPKHVV